MPALSGTDWISSAPLTDVALRGRVVVVNFWTLTCINWLRQVPYVRAWSEAYRDDGLVVIGVHTPEFSFEHEPDRVRLAVKDRAIDYPVVLDGDYAIWDAFDNHYWPALYFVDRDGIIRHELFGEGRYEHSEHVIQRLLEVTREPVSVEPFGVEAAAAWDDLRTPETYLGYRRSGQFGTAAGVAPDGSHAPEATDRLQLNEWSLAGTWTIGPENLLLTQAGGSIACRFHARDAHLVLSAGAHDPIPFRVLLDGRSPGRAHGVDTDEFGAGLLDAGRMYQLIRQGDEVGERTVQIKFDAPGAEAYAFTFG